jgi:hypothetical protein
MEIVTYSAVFGGYDTLLPARHPSLCFTDGGMPATDGWSYRSIYFGRDPRWANRQCKILVHNHLDCDISVYHDGNVQMLIEPEEAVRRWLRDADIAVFQHPEKRDCIYQEADEVLRQHKACVPVVQAQMERYEREGFPEHYGLSACYVLIRRHTKAVREFNEFWWQEYDRGAKRDQLSFDYVRWKTGVRVATIPGNLFEGTSDNFKRVPHQRLEQDFTMVDWKTAYGKQLPIAEREYLKALATQIESQFNAPVFVNIGIFRYASMYCLRAGATSAQIYGIDVKQPDVPQAPELRAIDIIADSAVCYKEFNEPVHLMFIDGDHHYEGVRADLENWTPKIVPGGIVAMHDYAPLPQHLALLPHLEGVRRAIAEWAERSKWEQLSAPGSLAAFRRPK